jgi:hypothetical protein
MHGIECKEDCVLQIMLRVSSFRSKMADLFQILSDMTLPQTNNTVSKSVMYVYTHNIVVHSS